MITISNSKTVLLSKIMEDVSKIRIENGSLVLFNKNGSVRFAIPVEGLEDKNFNIVHSELFASYIRSCLAEGKNIEFDISNGFLLKLGNIELELSRDTSSSLGNIGDTFISMSKDELVKNFRDNIKKFTTNNYWKSPKLADVSVIFTMEGTIFNAAPGFCSNSSYKIGKLLGTIDTAKVDQLFGHVKFGLVIPEVIYDICEASSSNLFKLGYNPEGGWVICDDFAAYFVNPGIKTTIFEKRLDSIHSVSYNSVTFDPIYVEVARAAAYAPITEEDTIIKVTDGEIFVNDSKICNVSNKRYFTFNEIPATVAKEITSIPNLKVATLEEDTYFCIYDEANSNYYIVYKN